MTLDSVPDLAWALLIIVAAPATVVVIVAMLRGYSVKVWRETHSGTKRKDDDSEDR